VCLLRDVLAAAAQVLGERERHAAQKIERKRRDEQGNVRLAAMPAVEETVLKT
jgi:hypothetical protein